ncbi:MAG: hypothetical protein NTV77_03975 [Candidatus Azambacteria bacterium]|nr:hypothetical protein [Candidatus Azambacteria bacterium]
MVLEDYSKNKKILFVIFSLILLVGISYLVFINFPDSLSTIYMHALDWPPQAAVVDGPFTCVEAGSEITSAGRTEKHIINNREYCVTKQSEGAAGSIYTQYIYALPKGGKTVVFTFTIRATQCGNYDDPKKTECENERASFDIDNLIDRVAQTLKLTK